MQSNIENPVAKIFSAWALIGVTSWAEAASALAACYTALLIAEWLWKRVARPLFIRAGYITAQNSEHNAG